MSARLLQVCVFCFYNLYIEGDTEYTRSYHSWICSLISYMYNDILNRMVSVIASTAVDRGFEPRSGQTRL